MKDSRLISKNQIIRLMILFVLLVIELSTLVYLQIEDPYILVCLVAITIGIFIKEFSSALIIIIGGLLLIGVMLNILDETDTANIFAVYGYICLVSWVIIEIVKMIISKFRKPEHNIKRQVVDP